MSCRAENRQIPQQTSQLHCHKNLQEISTIHTAIDNNIHVLSKNDTISLLSGMQEQTNLLQFSLSYN
jgi:hypothetical protein